MDALRSYRESSAAQRREKRRGKIDRDFKDETRGCLFGLSCTNRKRSSVHGGASDRKAVRKVGQRVSSRIISEIVVGEERLQSRSNELSNAEEVHKVAIESGNARRQRSKGLRQVRIELSAQEQKT